MPAIIIIFHTPSNAGYAMEPLEKMFYQVALNICGNKNNIHFAFKDINNGKPTSLPDDFDNYSSIDTASDNSDMLRNAQHYIQKNNITVTLCFDLQVRSPICTMLRNAGVKTIVSYWGAPISPLNKPLKLLMKRIEVALSKNKPDLFIFESEAMRELAVYGRGLSKKNTTVIPTGVDTNRFQPDRQKKDYVTESFNIDKKKKIAFYSGHMEARKGVKTIIESAIFLVDNQNIENWHFLFCGNRPGEEEPFLEMLEGTTARDHVTFAGYRTDIDQIIPGCDIGIIASTGWDSFPMSCLEIAACGLPLIVSSLQGLTETIENNVTGVSFPPGDSRALSNAILYLSNNPKIYESYSQAARQRIVSSYSLSKQQVSLSDNIHKVMLLNP